MSVEPPPREWRFWSQTSVVTRNIMSEVMRSAVSLLGKRSPHKEEDLLGLIDPSPLETKKIQNFPTEFSRMTWNFSHCWKLSRVFGNFLGCWEPLQTGQKMFTLSITRKNFLVGYAATSTRFWGQFATRKVIQYFNFLETAKKVTWYDKLKYGHFTKSITLGTVGMLGGFQTQICR